MLITIKSEGQVMPVFTELDSLPDTEGYAGMFAGVSKGRLFCFGGANFPGKRPWEGGKKKWYKEIYMLQEGKGWLKLADTLPSALGYGITVSYKNQFIVIGGNNETGYSDKVFGYEWAGGRLKTIHYPPLPAPMANMAGALVGQLIILAGGNSSATGQAGKQFYMLDLDAIDSGWSALPSWPGRERMLPMCAVHNGMFYLFGGETTEINSLNQNYRLILDDAYRFKPEKLNGKWTGTWTTLNPMPKGLSAAGSPLPVLENGNLLFWGGVDALTALHVDPLTHPGISADVQLYNLNADMWIYAGKKQGIAAPVTLPVVNWNGRWLYISGEIKPGIRTNKIYELK
ncbi:hypothetical protein [Pedobacter heparinus]|uniref:hypothetical protein n=1 Tax=Pedobacter heparinus TaxID=984 RepID=UPI00292FD80A|nr:hypothetical protein [Pedobacter heparinus]